MDNVVLVDEPPARGPNAVPIPPTIKLCDFGFAKEWGSCSGAAMMTRIGTPVYMSPQVWAVGGGGQAGGGGGSGRAGLEVDGAGHRHVCVRLPRPATCCVRCPGRGGGGGGACRGC